MDKNQTKIGEFTTKTRFIEFVGGKGHVNFISNEATIEAKYLTGLDLDGINFKLTLCDANTVDFVEIDTNVTTNQQRKRLLEIIEEKTATTYRNRTVIQELPFMSTKKVKDKLVPLYLAIEFQKPIDKLGSLIEDYITISEDVLSNLDELLNSWSDEDFTNDTEEPIFESEESLEDVQPSTYLNTLEDSFTKLKEDKLNELKSRREKTKSELSKLEFQLKTYEKNASELESELKLLSDRIDDLQPILPSNGYYFFVSERQNETVLLEPEIEKIIKDKVSKVKSINVENFMKLFTDGEFHIKLSKKTDTGFELVEDYTKLDSDIYDTLSEMNLGIDENHLIYMGELTWAQIVNKLIKLGFEQNPEFDKSCDSNSYHSKTEKPKVNF